MTYPEDVVRQLLFAVGDEGFTVAELRRRLVQLRLMAPTSRFPLTPFLSAYGRETGRSRRLTRKHSRQPVWVSRVQAPEAARNRLRARYGISSP